MLKEEEGVTGTTDSQDGQTEEVVKKLVRIYYNCTYILLKPARIHGCYS